MMRQTNKVKMNMEIRQKMYNYVKDSSVLTREKSKRSNLKDVFKRGPPLWTRSRNPFMDPVHGPSLWTTTPHFVKLQAGKSLDERGKLSSRLSGNCLLSTPEKFRWLQRDWKPMTLCDAGAIFYQLSYEAKSRSICSGEELDQ